MPTFDATKKDALYCLFKGEPGTRKSTQALSFPKPILFASWDRKIDALGIPIHKWKINPKDVFYESLRTWTAGETLIKKLIVDPSYNGRRINTFVIDTITTLVDSINKQTMKDKGYPNKVGSIAVNSIEDYKAEESALVDLIDWTKDIYEIHKVNIILIAHIIQKEMKSEGGKTHFSRTIITAGKAIAQKIPAKSDEVYHFNIQKGFDPSQGGNYALLTTHTGDDFARTSLPLDKEITFGDEPLYEKWIAPAIQKYNSYFAQPTTQPTNEPKKAF